jgi:tetratricopeptide (TPR) repeat protein
VGPGMLVDWYRELPQPRPTDDPDLWGAAWNEAVRKFRSNVRKRYSEGTLQRLLDSPSSEMRQAAVVALGMVGRMQSNAVLAARLHDLDEQVARLAADALWDIWFRGSSEQHNRNLRLIIQLPDFQQALAGLDDLIRQAPDFAEAYNQRAILLHRRGEFLRALHDCESALRLNPFHFGAQSGMAQCYLKLGKPRAALRAFRLALQINPALPGVMETVHSLEERLRESGSPGDRLEG